MLIESIFDELKKIILNMEIKYKYLGEKRDTPETRYNADRYINAMEQADTFFSHTVISMEAIIMSGLTLDKVKAAEYSLEPTSIPVVWRNKVLECERRIIIDTYDEGNNYYRRLNGLPEAEQTAVYLDVDFYDTYDIEFKALHEFTDVEIMVAEAIGKVKEVQVLYPELKYLHYLGEKRINLYTARKAANFQVLRVDYKGDHDLLDRFLTIYDQCREYTMRILYVNEFSSNDAMYDNFMAMMTTIMTVQRTLTSIYQGVISRDFFDVHLVQALFESYGVPFIKSLPMDYQKLLAKNLDKLLHFKSTDKVIYDITEILGFNNAEIFKYFLVKDHQFDVYGKPIYEYVTDKNGVKTPNYNIMYDVYFQTMSLKEKNEEFALADKGNRREYNEVIADDAYWWSDDAELLKRLYETEFTYIETKYLHMNVMFKITEMIFELVHVFRILQDKRSQTNKLLISIPRILTDRKITLFTFTIFMCAAIAKRNNLTGEIITAPSKTLYLLGFDFEKDLIRIRKSLEENSEYVDRDTIAGYISNMEAFTTRDVDRLFNNIRDLWEFLSVKLKQAKTIEEYRAYERIYQALLVTQDMEYIFMKSDGHVATTYLDMLRDLDPYLATLIDIATPENLFAYLNHGIDSIQYVIKDTKYMHGLTDTSQVMVEALRKLILFFKSYTVDLKDFNIIYIFDHPYLHGIKIISQLMEISSEIDLNTKYIHDMMLEYLHIASEMSQSDRLQITKEIFDFEGSVSMKHYITFLTKLASDGDIDIDTKHAMIDILTMDSEITKFDKLQFIKELFKFEGEVTIKNIISFIVKFSSDGDIEMNTKHVMIDTLLLDILTSISEDIQLGDNMSDIITEITLVLELFKQSVIVISSDVSLGDKMTAIQTLQQKSELLTHITISLNGDIQSIQIAIEAAHKHMLEFEGLMETESNVSSKNIMISTLTPESMILNKLQILYDSVLDSIKSHIDGLVDKLTLHQKISTESTINIASSDMFIDISTQSVDYTLPSNVIKMREQFFVIRD